MAQFCLLLLRRSDYFKLSLGMTCCSFRSTKSNWEGKKNTQKKIIQCCTDKNLYLLTTFIYDLFYGLFIEFLWIPATNCLFLSCSGSFANQDSCLETCLIHARVQKSFSHLPKKQLIWRENSGMDQTCQCEYFLYQGEPQKYQNPCFYMNIRLWFWTGTGVYPGSCSCSCWGLGLGCDLCQCRWGWSCFQKADSVWGTSGSEEARLF